MPRESCSVQGLLHRQAVEELFDDYAEAFEDHLVRGLEYRGPEIIAGLVSELLASRPPPPGGLGVVVDLGCGTGLCGVVVRRFAARLVGVDVSEGMLDVARAKGEDGRPGGPGRLYDELLHMDGAVGLARQEEGSVDHIVAGDMFIYVWCVEHMFRACSAALRRGGVLIFTTEKMDEGESEQGWIERESERFAHSREFITWACEANGLKVECCRDVSLRREAGTAKSDGEKLARFLPAEAFVVRKM
mmetsp:Transcript_125465/g.390606  ORF Transcript_125465/g.390606 Transcript_125465/m.390606 type:complete len:246 (-) Transcript_125465:8-745(-)